MARKLPLFFLAVLVALLPTLVDAADLGSGPSTDTEALDQSELRAYLSRRATLYEIRRSFDVMTGDEPDTALHMDALAAEAGSLTERDLLQTEDDLLSEASYFIVSMRYLVTSGFPAWPEDRAARLYEQDSLAILEPLIGQLRASLETGDDGAEVLRAASIVYWWAEGETSPATGRADFSDIDRRVDRAISDAEKEAETGT